MKQKIDTVIFDLGGVLVDWKSEYIYEKEFNGDLEKMNWFLKNVCSPEWNLMQDAGRLIKDGIAEKVEEFPEYKRLINLFYSEWHNMFSGPIKKNVEIFKKLQQDKSIKIYALTNWCTEKWDTALKLFPFFNEFDGIVVSGQEKCVKPFPEIYHILFERFDINPKNAVFIDDNKLNIVAAKTLGLNTVHYSPKTNLFAELEAFGILK